MGIGGCEPATNCNQQALTLVSFSHIVQGKKFSGVPVWKNKSLTPKVFLTPQVTWPQMQATDFLRYTVSYKFFCPKGVVCGAWWCVGLVAAKSTMLVSKSLIPRPSSPTSA